MYQRKEEVERDYETLLALMVEMITAQARQPVCDAPEWTFSLHALSLKLFKHLCTARWILEPSPFETKLLPAHGYIDHSSVAVIVRSAIENYLVMHWLFADGDSELCEFRHMVWVHAGWKKRSKITPTIEESIPKRQAAIDEAAELLPKIEKSPYFERLRDDQKKKLRKGMWDADWTWNDLADSAGLHLSYFTSIYQYLSGYTHSDFISAMQIDCAKDIQTHYDLGSSMLGTGLLIMGHFAQFYSRIFPAAHAVFDAAADRKEVAHKFNIKAEDMEAIYASTLSN
ncbi:DUF5677 domain-containing protein [Pseudomonas aeruginosa]|uniref:DUF5677 domain-containing protein n=1 Tax=Pseudomonas aeruginosa TaxID=287 RepID=UPI0037700BD9|nr:AraC family transcriptional regulator [Pseudomonas aeruginosa]